MHQDKRKPPEERLNTKLGLTRRLYERKYNRKEIIDLYRFIDNIIRLPEERVRRGSLGFLKPNRPCALAASPILT